MKFFGKPVLPREGHGTSRLIDVVEYVGYNPGGTIVRATVTKEPPNLAIQIDTETIEVPLEGLVCNPELLAHTQTVKIDGISKTIEYPNRLTVGTKVYVYEPENQQILYILALAE